MSIGAGTICISRMETGDPLDPRSPHAMGLQHDLTSTIIIGNLEAHLTCKNVAQLLPDCKVIACGKGSLLQTAVARPQRHPHRIWKRLELQIDLKGLRSDDSRAGMSDCAMTQFLCMPSRHRL